MCRSTDEDSPCFAECRNQDTLGVGIAYTQGVFTIRVHPSYRNWGLTETELSTIPPSLVRGFMKNGRGGFGAEMPGGFGRLLMRDAKNSELYGSLQTAFVKGR